MSKTSEKYSVNATLFAREYEIGYDPIYSLRATRLSSGRYLVESKSGKGPIEVSVGDQFMKEGKVSLSKNGDLLVGKRVIPVGHQLVFGVTAEPKDDDGTKFAIFTKGKAKKFYKQITVGELDERTNQYWNVDQYNNLINGNSSVKVLPQLNSKILQVRGQVSESEQKSLGIRNAYYATFDYLDSSSDRPYTTWGYYVKNSFNNKEGDFREVVNGELVTTAKIRLDGNGFNISIRTPEQAYLVHTLYERRNELERQLAAMNDAFFVNKTLSGMSKDVVEQFKVELNEQLDEIKVLIDENKGVWVANQRFFAKKESRDFMMAKYVEKRKEQNVSPPEP